MKPLLRTFTEPAASRMRENAAGPMLGCAQRVGLGSLFVEVGREPGGGGPERELTFDERPAGARTGECASGILEHLGEPPGKVLRVAGLRQQAGLAVDDKLGDA